MQAQTINEKTTVYYIFWKEKNTIENRKYFSLQIFSMVNCISVWIIVLKIFKPLSIWSFVSVISSLGLKGARLSIVLYCWSIKINVIKLKGTIFLGILSPWIYIFERGNSEKHLHKSLFIISAFDFMLNYCSDRTVDLLGKIVRIQRLQKQYSG